MSGRDLALRAQKGLRGLDLTQLGDMVFEQSEHDPGSGLQEAERRMAALEHALRSDPRMGQLLDEMGLPHPKQ